ncbi:Sun protein (Fmu protein) [Prochlorococcus marinus str. MIT 9515]|uniref:16S rRNA (cytosine(967)-C(5))-methyltransferase n=1 Tax=Prochlorococcus marinus (strain MIT 9515) TaxID=167542 RepID=A2BV86_PROM5|nr:16S rRNA (cytosine(967)-C(5))-methyltransferase [Prochlorococcus marinus]ABM71697.1 Sun protein (Fmu protein) [Prochlorococcus marinus str. MIT 9515]
MATGYLQRKASWEILLKVSSGIYSDHALEKVLKNYEFNSLDIAFITELSFGCIRYRKFLDTWIDHISKLSHQKQPPKLRWLLHIGLYQLLKMDKIPFPAAISSTVEVAKRTDLKGLAGTVNAILRNTVRNIERDNCPKISTDEMEKLSCLESLPLWLVTEIVNWVGIKEAKNIFKAFNKKPTIDLRINSLKTNFNKILKELNECNIQAEPINQLNNGVALNSNPRSIKNLPGYKDGLWVVQDRSSQWVAPLLNPKKGEKILDACSAPGSKTTHLAALVNDDAEILAVDRSEKRLKILQSNLERLNIKSVKTLEADATTLIDIKPNLASYFDKILIDAPCSGIGTFARNPDTRWSLSKDKINQLIILQEGLLDSIFPLLKKNGTLVYSTCTICPDENNLLIRRFLSKNKELKLDSERQILPRFDKPGDGFYAATISYK